MGILTNSTASVQRLLDLYKYLIDFFEIDDVNNKVSFNGIAQYPSGDQYSAFTGREIPTAEWVIDKTQVNLTVPSLTISGETSGSETGKIFYDYENNSIAYYPDTELQDVIINIGQETLIYVYNQSGQDILNGDIVRINGVQTDFTHPTIELSIASGTTTLDEHAKVSGVATHNISNGYHGFITVVGKVNGITVAGNPGDTIYLSDTEAGKYVYDVNDLDITSRVMKIGTVLNPSTGTTGSIFVELNKEQRLTKSVARLSNILTTNNSSTGLMMGGNLSFTGNTISISAGNGYVIDNTTDPNDPTPYYVSWETMTGITLTYLNTNISTYILLDKDSNVIQIPTETGLLESDKRSKIYLGFISHLDYTNIFAAVNLPLHTVSPSNQLHDLTASIGPFNIAGNVISGVINTLNITKTSGKAYMHGANFQTDPTNPSRLNTPALTAPFMLYATQSDIFTGGTDIDTNYYDNDGTLSSIPSNKYVAHRLYHGPNLNTITMHYGQYIYNSQAEALAGFQFEHFSEYPGLSELSYVNSVCIVVKGATTLNDAVFVSQGKFAGTGGGGSGSVDTLQSAYNNSTQPEILTDSTRGSVDIRIGSGSDTDNALTVQNNASTINFSVNGEGDITTNDIDSNDILSNKIRIGLTAESNGANSFAQGPSTIANGAYSTALNYHSTANGWSSHAEGSYTSANAQGSHAQGRYTITDGDFSHAGGQYAIASGDTSFNHSYQTIYGTYGAKGDYSAILGGQNQTIESNATNSVIIGGSNIIADSANTVFVPYLNIGTISQNDDVSWILGRDTNGNIVQKDVTTFGGGGAEILGNQYEVVLADGNSGATTNSAFTFIGNTLYITGSTINKATSTSQQILNKVVDSSGVEQWSVDSEAIVRIKDVGTTPTAELGYLTVYYDDDTELYYGESSTEQYVLNTDTIERLLDTDIGTKIQGDVLAYNATTANWENNASYIDDHILSFAELGFVSSAITELADSVVGGYSINSFKIKNNDTSSIVIDLSTTSGATGDILSGYTIEASTTVKLQNYDLDLTYFDDSNDQPIWISFSATPNIDILQWTITNK